MFTLRPIRRPKPQQRHTQARRPLVEPLEQRALLATLVPVDAYDHLPEPVIIRGAAVTAQDGLNPSNSDASVSLPTENGVEKSVQATFSGSIYDPTGHDSRYSHSATTFSGSVSGNTFSGLAHNDLHLTDGPMGAKWSVEDGFMEGHWFLIKADPGEQDGAPISVITHLTYDSDMPFAASTTPVNTVGIIGLRILYSTLAGTHEEFNVGYATNAAASTNEIQNHIDRTDTINTYVGSYVYIDVNCFGSGESVTNAVGNWVYNTNFAWSITAGLDQTITFNTIGPKTYGDPDFMVSAIASSGLPVTLTTSNNCTATQIDASHWSIHVVSAGDTTITATQAGNGTYNPVINSQSFAIAKANATISVTPYNITYDGTSHTAIGTATGVKGERLSGLDLSSTTHTDVGDYPTDHWVFTDTTGNYNNASGTVHDSITSAATEVVVTGLKGTLRVTVPAGMILPSWATENDNELLKTNPRKSADLLASLGFPSVFTSLTRTAISSGYDKEVVRRNRVTLDRLKSGNYNIRYVTHVDHGVKVVERIPFKPAKQV